MLAPKDIRNPARKSGFNYVNSAEGDGPNTHGGGQPYRAAVSLPGLARVGGRRHAWRGPRRATGEEAAQDYCDYMNGKVAAVPTKPTKASKLTVDLRRAGHASRRIAKGALRRKKAGDRRQTQKLGYVYCIGEENNSTAVKIGYAKDATLRIGSLQTGNPRKLVILGVIRGTRADERELHAEYQHDNILGEWFRPTQSLLSEFDVDMEMIA